MKSHLDFLGRLCGKNILKTLNRLPQRLLDAECVKLRSIFSRLDYPAGLIDSAINNFIFRNPSAGTAERNTDDSSTVRISLPFKYQVAAGAVRKQLRDLSHKILPTLQPTL